MAFNPAHLWPDEQRLRSLQAIYALQTCVVVLGRVLAYSWVLEVSGSRTLPHLYLLLAIPQCLTAFTLLGLVDRLGRAPLMTGLTGIFFAFTLLAWGAHAFALPLSAPIYLLGVETFIAILSMQFWLITSDLVSPEQSRQHFPYFSLYGALGALLASGMVYAIRPASTSRLLLLLLGPLLALGLLSRWLQQRYAYRVGPRVQVGPAIGWRSQLTGVWDLLHEIPLIWPISVLNALITSSGLLIDYMYYAVTERLQSHEQFPIFFSSIQLIINLGQLLFVVTFGDRIFTRVGVLSAIRSYPALGGLMAGLALLVAPTWPVVAIKILDRLENYLVLNPGVGLLLGAFPKQQRGRAGLFYAGILKPLISALIGALMVVLGTSIPTMLLLLGLLLALFFPTLAALGQAWRGQLLQNLRSHDRLLVANSIEALGEPDNRVVVPELLQFLHATPDPVFRENGLRSAGRIRDERFLPILLQSLEDPNISLKCAAAQALSGFPSPEVKEALLATLHHSDSSRVKASILSTLGASNLDLALAPILLESLVDPDERVQANAVEAIGLTRDPQLIAAVIPFLSSPVPRIWANAAVALARSPAYKSVALEHLRSTLMDQNPRIASSALYAAGEVGTEELTPLVLRATVRPEPEVHRNAWVALGRMNQPGAILPLVALITAGGEHALATARNLDRLGPDVREGIIAALSRAFPEDRARAIQALRDCGINYAEELERLMAVP